MSRADFLAPVLQPPAAPYAVRNRRTAVRLADRAIPALDSTSRRRGLLKHASLPEGDAMIIAPTCAVHTFGMRFPIDVVFVARDGRVLKTRAAVGPWRMTGALGAHAVIEMAAGTLERHDTRPGDVLEIVPA